MEAIKKRVNSRFFHEKNETLKKIFFSKSPQKRPFLICTLFVSKWKQKIVQ